MILCRRTKTVYLGFYLAVEAFFSLFKKKKKNISNCKYVRGNITCMGYLKKIVIQVKAEFIYSFKFCRIELSDTLIF